MMMKHGKATREVCPAHGPWTLNSPILMSGLGVEKKTVSQMLNSSLNVGVGVDQKEEPTRREEGAVARWHWKEEFLAEDGGLNGLVWKQTGEAGAQTPPPSPRVPVVEECGKWPLEGTAGKAVNSAARLRFQHFQKGRQTKDCCVGKFTMSKQGIVSCWVALLEDTERSEKGQLGGIR